MYLCRFCIRTNILLEHILSYLNIIMHHYCVCVVVRVLTSLIFFSQISYTATSISLSDKGRFPNFLRTISSDNASIDTITAVVREYGWRQVAVVTEMSELYSNVISLTLSS